jgi:hypothetical protein
MATSGSYNFTMSANDIVNAALRQTGRFAAGQTIPADDINNALQALNIIVKAMVKNQLPLWCISKLNFPTVIGQQSYNLATLSGMPRPLRVLYGFIRDSAGNDTTLSLVSRDDYNQLGSKASQGTPNQAYYDPQLTNGALYLYDAPVDTTHTIHLDLQRQIQDFDILTDNPDFPQEAHHMLKWCLADEIALEYLTPQDIRADIKAKAGAAYEGFFANEREAVSSYFTPSERR